MKKNKKRGQEEMVGFGIIIGIVAIILLIFLWFALTDRDETSLDDYKTESFLQSALQYTTECEGSNGFYEINELSFECDKRRSCLNGKDSCEILNTTIREMLEAAWKGESSVKGYSLNITSDGNELMPAFVWGNLTGSSRGAREEFPKPGTLIGFVFKIYS